MNQTILCCADWGQITVSYTVLPLRLTPSLGHSTSAFYVRKTQADQHYPQQIAAPADGRNGRSLGPPQKVYHDAPGWRPLGASKGLSWGPVIRAHAAKSDPIPGAPRGYWLHRT